MEAAKAETRDWRRRLLIGTARSAIHSYELLCDSMCSSGCPRKHDALRITEMPRLACHEDARRQLGWYHAHLRAPEFTRLTTTDFRPRSSLSD